MRAGRKQHQLHVRRVGRSGFTLVELLVAMALAALIASVTSNIAVQAVATRDALRIHTAQREKAKRVFDILREDLSHRLEPPSGAERSVSLYDTDPPMLVIRTLATIDSDSMSLHAIRRPCVVRYHASLKEQDDSTMDIVRETIDQTDPTAAVTRETIAHGLERWSVSALVGQEWLALFPTGNQARRNAALRALRITIGWPGDDHSVTQTVVMQ